MTEITFRRCVVCTRFEHKYLKLGSTIAERVNDDYER